jgi:GT2 family glycosyltransferase
MDQPDARTSVVIVTRNRRDGLLHTVDRHRALPERPPVVVVDDASTDGTAGAVRARHPDVELIRLERSAGAAGRNAGIAAVQTPYVALSDDDSWWAPGALRRAADLLDRHPRLAAVNAHILVGPQEREDDISHEMAASPLPRAPDQPGAPLLSFVGCAVVLRRDAVLAAGGFSERLGVGGEEELLGWDLAALGWQLSYVADIRVHHHPPPSGPGGRPDRRALGIRNTLWTTWLRRPTPAAARRTLALLRRVPADRVTARALAGALAGAPWVLRERRVSPPEVEAMRRRLDDQQLRSRSRRYVD